ncbi:hypothetical protein RM780_21605 [Streptomyces sp. DSM 44917]|uniref:Transposase IS701-like DDE domain-containing protein n=1 Tax=Streptomyces boetiae TaxID=3075541 RepID=A0ABU2LEC9_9ACTN|nr:hypothetical protein [Streptomyces sp. DSM 44917]MDT0309533.1 hypothetical protein [Streptomyces sp. DSM 44917]
MDQRQPGLVRPAPSRARAASGSAPAGLTLPASAPSGTAGDAVGIPEDHGRRILGCLPRSGAVFACSALWWWVVPPDSQIGLDWPATARYWPNAVRPGAHTQRAPHQTPAAPRHHGGRGAAGDGPAQLVHWPEDAAPFTHPLLLYVAVCRLAGVPPVTRLAAQTRRQRPRASDAGPVRPGGRPRLRGRRSFLG